MKFRKLILAVSSLALLFSADTLTAQTTNDMTYRGVGFDVLDSAYIPKSRMEQQTEFLNYQYSHPAKPRNQWEIGIKGGLYNLVGSDVPHPYFLGSSKTTGNFGLTLRKALGYSTSLRVSYEHGAAKGTAWAPYTGYLLTSTTNQWDAYAGQPVVPNYKMISNAGYVDFIYNIGNISFHKAEPRLGVYLFGGLGVGKFRTYHNTKGSDGQNYIFNNILANQTIDYDHRKDVIKTLEDNMDDTYETESTVDRGTRLYNVQDLKPLGTGGAGIQFLLGKKSRVSLGLEDRITFWNSDILDGQYNTNSETFSATNDMTNSLDLTLGFNLGNKNKTILPLWWVNPTDYMYSELTNPRHLKTTYVEFLDADGDGVLDALDQEPNTPAGCPVNTHGVSLDTDGDGVPDCRDKELITPTECQPVDADGVGKCPCCVSPEKACNLSSYYEEFAMGSSTLSSTAMGDLNALYSQMSANNDCKVVVEGHGNNDKRAQQRAWDRVNKIINYMTDKGIDRDRFIFRSGTPGNQNIVEIRAAAPGEAGDSNVPPPFPNLIGK